MKKDYCALSFSEKERDCERTFEENGPYWHLYTDGTRMQDIFCCEEDFATGMWTLAGAAHQQKEVRILTFQIMNNHLHKILAGSKEGGIEMFASFEARLRRSLAKTGRAIDWSRFKMEILPINDLKALRNEIICRVHPGLLPMGRWLRIFQRMDGLPAHITIRRPESCDTKRTSTPERCCTIRRTARNQHDAFHSVLLRHTAR